MAASRGSDLVGRLDSSRTSLVFRRTFSSISPGSRKNLGLAPVFYGRADHSPGVGDEIRNTDDSLVVQVFFGAVGERDVGALHHQLGLEAVHVASVHHVRAGRRNPDVAIEVDNGLPVKLFGL